MKTLSDTLTRLVVVLLSGVVFAALWYFRVPVPEHPQFSLPEPFTTRAPAPFYSAEDVSGAETAEAHSANLAIRDDRIFAVWYAGTEEGHKDVALYMSTFSGSWSPAVRVMDRRQSEKGLDRYIRKVGNPAIHVWPDGAIGIFYVTVSVGGWAASAVNYLESTDDGTTWSEPRRLVTSPFLNLSTLVRTVPVELSDGSLLLPVYHEFLGKFAETLRLTRDLRILDKTRISHGKHSLQPAVAAVSEEKAITLLRYAGAAPMRLLSAVSEDGGDSWSAPISESLPNPDAAVALLSLRDDRLLLALNDTEDGRHRLSVAIGHASATPDWRVIKVIEHEEAEGSDHEFQFSYPSMVMDDAGVIHLVYTWNQTRIRHVRFNRAWLDS
jgi:predicted neuraminidase